MKAAGQAARLRPTKPRDGTGRTRAAQVKSARGATEPELGPGAMRALAAIRLRQRRPDGLVFELSESQICNRVRQAAAAAGLEGRFSGESPRPDKSGGPRPGGTMFPDQWLVRIDSSER